MYNFDYNSNTLYTFCVGWARNRFNNLHVNRQHLKRRRDTLDMGINKSLTVSECLKHRPTITLGWSLEHPRVGHLRHSSE